MPETAACSCDSPRYGWCALHRRWLPVLPDDLAGRLRVILAAEEHAYRSDPRVSVEPRGDGLAVTYAPTLTSIEGKAAQR